MKRWLQENGTLFVVPSLAIAVYAIYAQTFRFDFINLDDNLYVYENAVIRSGLSWDSVSWAFSTFQAANWHPVTWLSLALDVEMFGVDSGKHHAVNVVIHLLNSVLAYFVFGRLSGSASRGFLVAALFAVHPVHVESVAWISERKDVLSTLFWLLTMLTYAIWCEKGSILRSRWYGATIIFFGLGLMSKPMLVTLPFVLLLCDMWPLERWKLFDWRALGPLLLEKFPLFVLAIASCVVTVIAQRSGGAFESLEYLPLSTRSLNAVVSYAQYVGLALYPFDLAIWYPYEMSIPLWQIVTSIGLIGAITVICIWQMKQRTYLLFGWLWFLGTLVPVIGLVQVGAQSMADRYTYVPFFGLFIMAVWGVGEVVGSSLNKRIAAAIISGIVLVVLSVVSFKQTALWRNSETLFVDTLSKTKGNFLISHNLCYELMMQDRFDEAERYCAEALSIRPEYYLALNTLGIIELKRGRIDESEQFFVKAVRSAPDNPLSYGNLAVAQAMAGRPEDAEENLERAVQMSSNSVPPSAWINTLREIARAYSIKSDHEKAVQNYLRILNVDPTNLQAMGNMAYSFCKLGRYAEALSLIQKVYAVSPNDPAVNNIVGLALLGSGRAEEAKAMFENAVKLDPDFAEAKENLKKAKGELLNAKPETVR